MAADLIHLMHALFLPAGERCREAAWCPPADIYRTPEGWMVKLDLAGVRPEDVQVQAAGRRLQVRGIRRDCSASAGCSFYLMEIAYSRFQRDLELPCDLDRAQISTEYRDGMLFVLVHPEESHA